MLIDVDVSVGHWPFQRLKPDTAEQLAGHLQDLGVDQGLVSAVETALYPDPHEYNVSLLTAVAHREGLRPVPVLNPSLPGWEACLASYLDRPAVPAVKILPNYHLYALDGLREGIGLRAYAQKDPLVEYKQESFRLFEQMMADLYREAVTVLFRAQVRTADESRRREPARAVHAYKPDAAAGGRGTSQREERPEPQASPPAGAGAEGRRSGVHRGRLRFERGEREFSGPFK